MVMKKRPSKVSPGKVGKRPLSTSPRPHEILPEGPRVITYYYNRQKHVAHIDVRPEIGETRVLSRDYQVLLYIKSINRNEVQQKLRALARKQDLDAELIEYLPSEPKEGSLQLEIEDRKPSRKK